MRGANEVLWAQLAHVLFPPTPYLSLELYVLEERLCPCRCSKLWRCLVLVYEYVWEDSEKVLWRMYIIIFCGVEY